MRWSGAAAKKGYGITLHMDSQTRTEVEEFSTSGFIGVLRNLVLTGDEEELEYKLVVPDSNNVIPSITSASVLEIAKGWGWEVERRAVGSHLLHNSTLCLHHGAVLVLISFLLHRSSGKSCGTSRRFLLVELQLL